MKTTVNLEVTAEELEHLHECLAGKNGPLNARLRTLVHHRSLEANLEEAVAAWNLLKARTGR